MNTLSLVEFLLKNGSPKFKLEAHEDQYFIKKFRTFEDDGDEEDLSKSIQTLAARILSFLENPEELKLAKEEAKKLKERIMGFSSELDSDSTGSLDGKYKGISSDSYQNDKDSWRKEVNLAQRLGLEEKEERAQREEKQHREEAVASQNSQKGSDIDLLGGDFGEPVQLKTGTTPGAEVDFFETEVAKPKQRQGGKLLPPPPKKAPAKGTVLQPTTPDRAQSQTDPQTDSLMNVGLIDLNFSQPKQPLPVLPDDPNNILL